MRGVVVDGIGCAGKSELITALKEDLKAHGGYDVRELDHRDDNDQFRRYLREYASGEHVLFHRCHISETVFGQILRSQLPFSKHELATLDAILSLRFVCILAEPPDFITFANRMTKRSRRPSVGESEYVDAVEAFRTAFQSIPHERYISLSLHELARMRERVLRFLA